MNVHKKSEDIINRLAKVEGHVRGIAKMVREDKDCPAILLQIAAVQSALSKISQIVLDDHVETCVAQAIKEGRGEAAVQELKEAIARLI
ncbi:MAG: CsoR family transcriptional regulator, copper-sensing transcriptional repressor [Thermoproteota archaeon]|nr:CsoR family transcriptional regulator, copper-sensing transcriptional repressor [Thermoproteota archaeon]